MRKLPLILLILLCCLIAIPFVQADQIVPFLPLGNVTGNYTFSQGNDLLEINTNFPLSSQDVVYPEWLYGMMIAFILGISCFGIWIIARAPDQWVCVIACGILIFGLGLAAAEMTPLVGYSEVFHQIVPTTGSSGSITLNATNTIYVNEVVVYTMGTWAAHACWGIAIGGGFIFMVAGFLLQMKEAKRVADAEQSERIRDAENFTRPEQSIRWRKRDRL
jgi:hypothetical protein